MDYVYWAIGLLCAFGAFQIFASIERLKRRSSAKHWDVSDADNQLRFVSKNMFKKKRLMNKSEYGAFRVLENWVAAHKASGYRLFAQVNLGEFLWTPNNNAFKSINSKRTDFLIIDASGHALCAIEYQGDGHYQDNAAKRDIVKATALSKAGIQFVEIFPDDTAAQIELKISEALH